VDEDVEGIRLRAGLRVPLVAQQEIIGLLIFHSTTKPRFAPREVALLRALANQSALAIQRASLIESLRDKIDRLEAAQAVIAQKERLDREMELAREVQQSMLPKTFPLVAGFEFAARSAPARHVGGDFYDVILLDAGLIGVAMADVVDKGMAAALYMALTRSLLLAEARRERSPALVLRRVHRLLLELMQPGLFVTIVYGVLDASAQTLTYVRAGHERPLLLRDGSTTLLRAKGAALGLPELDDVQLEEERIDLRAGDRIVLYTDGLADALGAADESFGLPRLVNALLTHRESALNEMCDAVFAAVAAHQGAREQYDDMSLLAVEVSSG
jgi:phosphoserine phosphatase RsbU/P